MGCGCRGVRSSSTVQWGRVRHGAAHVAIVGSGPSMDGVQLALPSHVRVIAVNHAILHVPRADMFFTLDARGGIRRLLAARRAGVTYYAAVRGDYGHPQAAHRDLRAPAEPHVTFLRRMDGPLEPLRGCPRLSESPFSIHGGNSAYGALGLAYLMGARRIALFGVDGKGGYAWGPGAPLQDLSGLGELFASALPQLAARGAEVVVGSPDSVVDCWPRMTPAEAAAWLVSPERAA